MTGGAGERHLAQSAGQRASHHFAMSSAFYAQGSTEGVAAALSMTAGPGYHHTGQGSTEGVSAALTMGISGGSGTGMFQPPPSGWYAARMDYPLHTQGFAQGHSAYGGPPMDFSYGPGKFLNIALRHSRIIEISRQSPFFDPCIHTVSFG